MKIYTLKVMPIFLSLLLLIIFFPSICLAADADKIFKENNKAVVVVVTFDANDNPISQGSGFIVRADGAVVTNYHVISNAKVIKIKVGDKILNVEGLIYTDKENDLVILKAKGEKLQTVRLGDIAKTNIGEKVYVISSPEGLENTISDGILSGIRDITSDRKVLQITAPVSSGSSGGPVFNKNGEVIGIATFILRESQNINFAMPVNLVKNKIESKKVITLKDSEIRDYTKTAEYWFNLGYYSLVSGMHKEAIEFYKQGIRIKPDYANAHLLLGAGYDKLGMNKEAIESYKQAIRLKPDHTDAHLLLGGAYGASGMYKEAIEAYKMVIRLKPDYTDAHYSLGLIYIILNNRGSALDEYKILKSLNSEKANELFDSIYE
ncbi:MAG: hypothetical protein A2W05_03935 [Candidatus Schekmanbacteria bacterium RBG_16_38_10]|uniref:Uncharacterized protein n=1 Tax=Candidatus Schekmanbacteria bacterium RBG_16_38_10 TaxID=1817879 RepID=A0A1F7RUR3_9BACT|nr:MAG: hypothetical protein A2W05_03935 [Candidatus Schekmanbacteria bacterium RBG_16_38_10]